MALNVPSQKRPQRQKASKNWLLLFLLLSSSLFLLSSLPHCCFNRNSDNRNFVFDRVLIEENIFFLFDLKRNIVCLFYGYFATFCKISQIFFNLECIVIKLNAWANIMSVANVGCLLSRPRSLDCQTGHQHRYKNGLRVS